jgi:uncharacterized protein YbjT (DUF2867 family)
VTATAAALPRLLLVGGAGGLVGRAALPELVPRYRIRSVHRHPVPNERSIVEWVSADVKTVADWAPVLDGVQVVVNVAWYRWSSESTFRKLRDGLCRLVEASARAGVRRFLQVSVPPAPAHLESDLPYLFYKRQVDAAIARSGLSYRIVRPTLLFGRGDVLVGVMLRTMRRYPFFPMFGTGEYHVSPIAASDLARLLVREAEGTEQGILDLGGPERLEYRELTDQMFRILGKPPRYWHLSAAGARRLTRLMVAIGSTTLYPYEVEWLMSDMLGLPPYEGLERPLVTVGSYLAEEAREYL